MLERFAVVLFLAVVAAPAAAQQSQPSPPAGKPRPPPPDDPPSPPPSSGAAAEVKAARGVENREPVDEGTTFAAGDTVYAWTRVTGAKGTSVSHVWKRDGAEVWKATLRIGSNRWTTHSRRKTSAGAWTVEVLDAGGAVIGSVAFTVQ
jgi:hypothetical protein